VAIGPDQQRLVIGARGAVLSLAPLCDSWTFSILSPLNVTLNTIGCFYNLSDTGQIKLKYQVNDDLSSFVGPGEKDEDLAAGSQAVALHLPQICSSENVKFGDIPYTRWYCLVGFEHNSTNPSLAKPIVTVTASNQDAVGNTTCCFAENNLTEYYAFRNLVSIKPQCSSFSHSEGWCVWNLNYCVYQDGTELGAKLTVMDINTHRLSSKNILMPLNIGVNWDEAFIELKALIAQNAKEENPVCGLVWCKFFLIPFIVCLATGLVGVLGVYYKKQRRKQLQTSGVEHKILSDEKNIHKEV